MQADEDGYSWTVTPEDMGPIVAALKLVISEIDEGFYTNHGVQVEATRLAMSSHLTSVLQRLTSPSVTGIQRASTAAAIKLTKEEASACGGALILAASRLDNFAGVESLRESPVAAITERDEESAERVRRHFSAIASDLAWVRVEGLRLRLHAHELREHQ